VKSWRWSHVRRDQKGAKDDIAHAREPVPHVPPTVSLALFRHRNLEKPTWTGNCARNLRWHRAVHCEKGTVRRGRPAARRFRSSAGVEQTKRKLPRPEGIPMLETAPCKTSDSAYGCFRRSPGFSLLAILCLTLGNWCPMPRVQLGRRHLIPPLPAVPRNRLFALRETAAWRARSLLLAGDFDCKKLHADRDH